MPRYSAQFRNTILKKLLPPENRSAFSVAKEYHISATTLYGWKARMKSGTLTLEEGVQANRDRPLEEKLSLLLESRKVPEDAMGQWLREQGLHSQHLTVWEQELRDALRTREQETREELLAAKQKIREQERELKRKEQALVEAAIIITTQKKISAMLQEPGGD